MKTNLGSVLDSDERETPQSHSKDVCFKPWQRQSYWSNAVTPIGDILLCYPEQSSIPRAPPSDPADVLRSIDYSALSAAVGSCPKINWQTQGIRACKKIIVCVRLQCRDVNGFHATNVHGLLTKMQ